MLILVYPGGELYIKNDIFGWHSPASQQKLSNPHAGAFSLCGVCMFSTCPCGFSLDTLASFHCLKICVYGTGEAANSTHPLTSQGSSS